MKIKMVLLFLVLLLSSLLRLTFLHIKAYHLGWWTYKNHWVLLLTPDNSLCVRNISLNFSQQGNENVQLDSFSIKQERSHCDPLLVLILDSTFTHSRLTTHCQHDSIFNGSVALKTLFKDLLHHQENRICHHWETAPVPIPMSTTYQTSFFKFRNRQGVTPDTIMTTRR